MPSGHDHRGSQMPRGASMIVANPPPLRAAWAKPPDAISWKVSGQRLDVVSGLAHHSEAGEVPDRPEYVSTVSSDRPGDLNILMGQQRI